MSPLTEPTKLTLAKGQPVPNDPYLYTNTTLLLHGDGANGSTNIVDSSRVAGSPKTVTPVGDAQISTAIADPFGDSTGVLAFDGTGDYLSVPRNAGFLFLSGEQFTVEAWVYLNATPGAQGSQIVGLGEYGTDSDWLLYLGSDSRVFFYFNSITTFFANPTVLSTNTWYHIAASRSTASTDNLKVFVNGNAASFTTNASTVFNGNRNLSIGADQNGDEANLNGYISNLRITKGVARYTSNFTPPTAPFPDF